MPKRASRESRAVSKAPTGIPGFDEITHGGLPRGSVTLVSGGPGSGKTIFAMQSLVGAARNFGESSLFVSFEEGPDELIKSAGNFGWTLTVAGAERGRGPSVTLFDGRPPEDMTQSGEFDLNGLLASLQEAIKQRPATRIVFDALDVLLGSLDDPKSERREVYRIINWVRRLGLTAIITAKLDLDDLEAIAPRQSHLPYLSASVVLLRNRLHGSSLTRTLRVAKYRGTAHSPNEHPLVISESGIEVSSDDSRILAYPVSNQRVSSGVKRLDAMLGGGYYRGSSVLVSGPPGTAKTTLAGAFIDAACARGERALFVSFDEAPDQILRNLRSVGLRLDRHARSGRLKVIALRAGVIDAEEIWRIIRQNLAGLAPNMFVIDPVSALTEEEEPDRYGNLIQRMVEFAKERKITTVMTTLMDRNVSTIETTRSQVSTIADTWMHLSFADRGGERNRTLTIIKSRGTRHSNQVRELVLGERGITLADVYSAGGEVLLGTARFEKEQQEVTAETLRISDFERQKGELVNELERISNNVKVQQAEIKLRRRELEGLQRSVDRSILYIQEKQPYHRRDDYRHDGGKEEDGSKEGAGRNAGVEQTGHQESEDDS